MGNGVFDIGAAAAQLQAAAEKFEQLVSLYPEAERYRQAVSIALFGEFDAGKAAEIISEIRREMEND